MSTAQVWALVPAKSFARAKSRLSGLLGEQERTSLAREMLEHVLEVLSGAAEIAGVMVVTDGDDVAGVARARGAVAVRDAVTMGDPQRVPQTPPASPPLGSIVDAALAELSARKAGAALVLMSDLPRLTAGDVRALVEQMAEADVVAAPDLRGEGTNALGVTPPDAFRTSFGTRDSFARHLRAAEAAGLRVGVHRSFGLAFDVDEPADLESLRRG
jgi:2-phospho-L-lactate guanylyltransferase